MLQSLTVITAAGHDQGYQWTRLGLDQGGKQFGLAVNFEESGAKPLLENSIGLFLRREIF